VSAPLDPGALAGLPDEVRADAADAPAAAVRVVDGVPVAVCAVSDLTETLWDVGIDTVEPARRQGHGTAVFLARGLPTVARAGGTAWVSAGGPDGRADPALGWLELKVIASQVWPTYSMASHAVGDGRHVHPAAVALDDRGPASAVSAQLPTGSGFLTTRAG